MDPSVWKRAMRRARVSARLVSAPPLRRSRSSVTLTVAFAGQSARPAPPPTLRDTGLYSDWATKTVAADNLPFSPQYPLWSDGAKKSRWMHIPKGTFIDGSNPDVWKFPVGTRLWKEFRFGAPRRDALHRAHPRGMAVCHLRVERGRERSRRSRRSRESGRACRFATASVTRSRRAPIAAPVTRRGPVRVLGVTALQLSPDRDPNAPHAEPPAAGAVDLTRLAARGLVRGLPTRVTASPPRIVAPTPTARAALGYLHANCGGCHTGTGELRRWRSRSTTR